MSPGTTRHPDCRDHDAIRDRYDTMTYNLMHTPMSKMARQIYREEIEELSSTYPWLIERDT